MPLRIRCPSGHKLIVPDDRAGRSLRCPRCGLVTDVPGERLDPGVATLEPGARGPQVEVGTPVAASNSGSGVFDWPNSIVAPTTIVALEEPPIVAAAVAPQPEPPPLPPIVKPKSRALPLPDPQQAPEPVRPSAPPITPQPITRSKPPLLQPVLPPVVAPPRSEPPAQPLVAEKPAPLPPGAIPSPGQAPPVALVIPPPAAALPAYESPAQDLPAPAAPATALGTDRGNVWAAYQLAVALVVAALFSMAPAAWDVVEYAQFPEAQFIARWALVLFLLGMMQLAYAAYLVQLPDWTSVWVVTIYSLVLAAVYAAVLGLVLISSEAGIVVAALQLSDKLAGGKAVLWCLSMVSVSTILAFFAGRLSSRWHTREATLRSAGLH